MARLHVRMCVQYAFAYFHFIMSKAKNAKPDFASIWSTEIDTNGDGVLNGNEVITLASLALGKEADDTYIGKVYDCVATELSITRLILGFFSRGSQNRGKSARFRKWERRSPHVATYDLFV